MGVVGRVQTLCLEVLDYFAVTAVAPVTAKSAIDQIQDRISRREVLFQRRLLAAVFLCNALVICLVFSFTATTVNKTSSNLNLVFFIACCVSGAWAMKRWPEYDAYMRSGLLVFFFLASNHLLLVEGGIDLFGTTPLMLLSLMALSLCGTAACLISALLSILSVHFWYHCKVSGMEICQFSRPQQEIWMQCRVGYTAFMMVNTCLALSLNSVSKVHRRELCEALIELEKARDSAQAGSQAKSSFLAHMSHELKTPLNGIIGMAELLLQSPLSELQRPYAETVYSCGKDLLMVINGILDFCRLEAKKLKLMEHPFDLYSLLKAVGHLMSRLAAEKNLELILALPQIDYPNEQDPTPLSTYFVGDEGRIRQILINLVGNAIKFSSNGAVKILVHIDTETTNEKQSKLPTRAVHFTVADKGVGIPLEMQSSLFQEFSQVDISTTRQYGGTGLGLSITKMLVQLMDGEISLYSDGIGQGCTVSFKIPLTLCEQQTEKAITMPKLTDLSSQLSVSVARDALQSHVQACLGRFLDINEDLALESISTDDSVLHITDNCTKIRQAVSPLHTTGEPSQRLLKVLLLTNTVEVSEIQSLVELIRHLNIPFVLLLKPFMGHDLCEALTRLSKMSSPPSPKALEFDMSTVSVPLGRARSSSEGLGVGEGLRFDGPLFSCVLVAEDNQVNRKLIGCQLRKLGWSYAFAEDGLQALEMYQRDIRTEEYRFGIILMDLHMPRLDGSATTKAVRACHKEHVEMLRKNGSLVIDDEKLSSLSKMEMKAVHPALYRVIIAAVTADTSVEAKQKAMESGVDQFIDKPIAMEKLNSLLEASRIHT